MFTAPIASPCVVFYLTSTESNIVAFTVFETFNHKVCDLDLARSKVIQGQRSWCQSIAHGWFAIRLPLSPSSYLSPFSKYLTWNLSGLELEQFKFIQIIVHSANRKLLGGFLSNLHCIQRRISRNFWATVCTRRPESNDRTARRQFQATGQPMSWTQASDAMTSRLPRYEAKRVQRRCFQCGSVPLCSDIKGTELPAANILIAFERQLIALRLCRWQFLYNETLQQTFRLLLSKLCKRRQI